MDLEEIKKNWLNREFDVAEFPVTQERILSYVHACGETDPRFCDPDHPDFQAPPTFTAQYVGRRILPEAFPHLGFRGFDAGKTVDIHAPTRPGDTLFGHSTIADAYEKTGRSGRMIFLVHRMEFVNQRDERVATVDWRMVRQPDDPPEENKK